MLQSMESLCLVTQSCPALCDPIDGSPPGSTIPGILQARVLEWVVAQRKRASPRGEAATSGFLSVSDCDRRVPAEL